MTPSPSFLRRDVTSAMFIPPRELRHPARMAEAQINFASFQIATHLPLKRKRLSR